jgi:hypothetical protein
LTFNIDAFIVLFPSMQNVNHLVVIFMASSSRRRARPALACFVREVAVPDGDWVEAGSSLCGWIARVDWTPADQNYLPDCRKRAALAVELEPAWRLAEQEPAEAAWVAPAVELASTDQDGRGGVDFRGRGVDHNAGCRYQRCG